MSDSTVKASNAKNSNLDASLKELFPQSGVILFMQPTLEKNKRTAHDFLLWVFDTQPGLHVDEFYYQGDITYARYLYEIRGSGICDLVSQYCKTIV